MARNNVVKNFSRFAKTYQPAFNVAGVGITIEHNEMYNGPHTALLWSGNYHTMQYNIVHDVRVQATLTHILNNRLNLNIYAGMHGDRRRRRLLLGT